MQYKNFFEEKLSQFKLHANGQATALCPFHDDHNPSFSCNIENGLWNCFGCRASGNFDQFIKNVEVGDEIRSYKPSPNKYTSYNYHSIEGDLLYQVRRYEPKAFRVFHWDGADWATGLKGKPLVPYNLPKIKNEDHVFIVGLRAVDWRG